MKTLRKKTIISLILTLIMIFNIIPFGAFRSVVNAATPISTLKFNGGFNPTVGANADVSGITKVGEGYSIKSIYFYNDTDSTQMTASDIFEEGKKYSLRITCNPDSGYEFADRESMTAELVGATVQNYNILVSGTDPSKPNRSVQFNFKALNSSHTVTFDANNGTTPTTEQVNDGATVAKPKNPTYGTLDFAHWMSSKTNSAYDFNTPVTSNITLKAIWQFTTSATAYPSGAGKVLGHGISGDYKETVSYTRTWKEEYLGISLQGYQQKAETGYKFKEWRIGSPTGQVVGTNSSNDIYVTSTNSLSIKGKTDYANKDFYAIFEAETSTPHTVTFINGNDSSTINTINVNDGETVAEPAAPPAPTGYTFDNWYADAEMTKLFNFNTPITAPTPIYAKFKINTYFINFDANGGTSSLGFLPVNHGSNFIISSVYSTKITPPSGKEFSHWTINGSVYNNGDVYSNVTSSFTLVAQWKPIQYTVAFYDGDTELTTLEQQVNEGENAIRPTAPTKPGLTFGGWYEDATYINSFIFENTPITKDIKLYARYGYLLEVDYNGGTQGAMTNPILVDIGAIVGRIGYEAMLSNPANAIPPTDKKFDYLELNGAKWTEDSYIANANATIKIIWKDIVKYTAKFDLNGGTGKDAFTPMDQEVDDDFESLIPTWDEIKDFIEAPYGKVYVGVEINGTKVAPGENFKVVEDVIIKLLWEDKYKILDGADQTYTIFSGKDIVIKASGDKANLKSITMDGTAIDTANYNTVNGSTILTLKSSYLDTVAPGSHKIGFVYNDGSVETGLTIAVANSGEANDNGDNNSQGSTNTENNTNNTTTNSKTPKTGDSIFLWMVLIFISGVGLVLVKRVSKK